MKVTHIKYEHYYFIENIFNIDYQEVILHLCLL